MHNNVGKKDPWKTGKKSMSIKEAKEEPRKRGKKGMTNKEGKE